MQPLALYVHLPFCSSKCHYCAFSVITDQQYQEHYMTTLLRELDHYRPLLAERGVDTVYIGGGTPSLTALPLLEQLFTALPKAVECTFECNPEQVTSDFVTFLQRSGVTRISMGVQTFDDTALRTMNRVHTAQQAEHAMELLRTSGISWNADLILGFPGTDIRQSELDLARVLHHKPDHLSAYFLSIEPGTVLSSLAHVEQDEDLLQRYKYFCATLRQAGFEHHEISNWARPGHACKHNLHYWHGDHYLGIGLGASSFLDHALWTNTRNLQLYLSGQWRSETPTPLSSEDLAHLKLSSGTRLAEGISWTTLAPYLPQKRIARLQQRAAILTSEGYLLPSSQGIIVDEDAYPLHDAILHFIQS